MVVAPSIFMRFSPWNTRHVTVKAITDTQIQDWGLLSKIHVKSHVSLQGFSNMASDWLAAVLPANQMPGLKIFVY